ncbi:hypothetical protein [Halorussus sp. MSC15.2]|uniref:hypothetical protein n=1 Tax=Halorussus sp. MSC15.2 TaxID=2283638 RepID=UPI0013D5F062|nr:hypothetical protein [Halorussus sp. MSC15.2]NEU58590.1 hypothetical protein [Halorussus sp. MSC15.2]
MVWKQYRRVDVGDLSIEDLDTEITVEMSKDGELSFDVSVWNLTEDSWSQIQKGDDCRIVLGWKQGPTKSVIQGVVQKRTKEVDGNDVRFRLKGTDETDERTKKRLSKTWRGKSPDRIATHIAGMIGLTTGEVESVGSVIDSNWAVSKDRPVRYWLDQLVEEAQKRSDTAWEWFVEAGKLYFVTKDGRKEQTVELSFDNSLVSIGESDGESNAEGSGLQFEALCEPRLRRGSTVVVNTDAYEGAYALKKYKFVSDTETGDHYVEGRLAPLDVEYTIR